VKTANLFHAGPSMSTINDLDPDALISRLAGPLSPPDRAAFRAAAEDALTRVPCWGEGAVYRAVAGLQRAFFDPPLMVERIGTLNRNFGLPSSKALRQSSTAAISGTSVIASVRDEGAPCIGPAPKLSHGVSA
jgi:hypothetical protein